MGKNTPILAKVGRKLIRLTDSFLYFFGGAMWLIGAVLLLGSVLTGGTGGEMILGLLMGATGFLMVMFEAEHRANAKDKGKSSQTIPTMVAVLLVAAALAVPQFASFAQDTATPVPPTSTPVPPVELDIDMGVMFEQINTFLPIAIAIFAIPIGLVIAFVLVRFIGNMLIKAFEGREL